MDPDEILAEGAEQLQAPATPEAEQYVPPTEAEMQEIAQAYFAQQQLNANLQSAYQNLVTQSQQEEPEEDVYDPNAIDSEDDLNPATIREMIRDEALAAQRQALNEHPMIQQMAEQRGAEIANQAFDAWKPELGEFDRNLALQLANGLGAQQPGVEPMQVLRMGAIQAKAYGDNLRAQAAAEYQTNMENRLNAPTPVPAGTSGAAVEGRKPSTSYDEVTKNFLANRNLQVTAN